MATTTTSATTSLFSPLPSTAFTYKKNPNLSTSSSSSSFICNFNPVSISISHNHNNPPTTTRLLNSRRSSSSSTLFVVSCSAVGLSVAAAAAAETSKKNNNSNGSSLEIAQLGISEEIVHALSRRGITELFPIQRAVLDPAMAGRDMIGRAITGSGKTLAFGIPILDKIIRNRAPGRQKRVPSALVLAPTRELARQVQKEFKESAPRLSSACLYGGMPIMNQVRALGFGIDIAVGTPGRIIDLVERGALNLSEVKFAVLDEADQMLAIGFQDDVERILSYLPKQKQCMLFSATMPSWVNELSRKYLRDPIVIDLVGHSDQKLADGISLYSVVSNSSQKENMLPTLISTYGQGGKSIVFTRTKRDAEDLSMAMRGRISSKALHGNMQQFQRDRTLAAFRDGRFDVLVATDVAARGLDIPNVDLVIHYEIPNTSEIFVHRSGRTGRAGKKGTAVLMYTKAQRRAVSDIERDLRCKFKQLPSIEAAGDDGNRMRSMDMGERSYGRNGSPRMSGLQFSEKFAERGSGSYSGYETRDRQSRGSRQTERFGYDTSRRSSFSRFPTSKSAPSRDARETRSNSYNEFKRNHNEENSSVDEKRQDGFRSILDMLKEQP